MKYQKKGLAFLAAAGLLSLNFVAGCNGDSKTDPDSKATSVTKSAAGKLGHVEASVLGGATESNYAQVNGEENWLYLEASGVWAVDISDFAAGITNKTWTRIPVGIAQAGFEDTEPAKAKLDGAVHVVEISSTKKGAFIAVTDETGSNEKNGFYYVEGDDIKNAWNHTGIHVNSGSGITSYLRAGKPIFAFEATAGDKGFVYATTRGNYTFLNVGDLGAALDKAVQTSGTRFYVGPGNAFEDPRVVQNGDGKEIYVVDKHGIGVIPEAKIGQDTSITKVARHDKAGSNFWKIGTANNDNVSDLAISGDKLYIALKSTGKDTGGVAVYNITAPATTSPAAGWNGVSVLNLATDETGKVWAVTKEGLVEAKADGSAGDKYSAPAEGELSLPSDNITSARFAKGNLVITTSDNGVFYRLK